MTNKINFTLRVKNLSIRSGSLQELQKEHYNKFLNEVQSSLGEFTINRNDVQFNLSIDWSKAINDYQMNLKNNFFMDELYIRYQAVKEQFPTVDDYLNSVVDGIPETTDILITLDTSSAYQSGSKVLIDQLLVNFLYNLFLVVNISCPGFLDLYNGRLVSDSDQKELHLSNYYFEEFWSIEDLWPQIRYIPIIKVRNWYDKLNIWERIESNIKIDKGLFCLLHFCEEEKISPSKIIWLAHALEAIYEIPQSSILQTLKERILVVLNENDNLVKTKSIVKNLNEFYQFRSNFVHGTLNLIFPSEELLQEDHNEYVNKLLELEQFTFRIVVATIQKLILEEWQQFNFTTVYNGD